MNPLKIALVSVVLASAAATLAGCTEKKPDAAVSAPHNIEDLLMQQGLQALYTDADPARAAQVFEDVLTRNPSHYGAHFQRAVALDRSGRPADARTEWTEVLNLAQASGDTAVQGQARRRLASPDTAGADAMMIHGLDLLYRQKNPAGAAKEFRAILLRNPTHYGATYQLATALDQSNQPADAKQLWIKVLGMAVMYKDTATAHTARERLK